MNFADRAASPLRQRMVAIFYASCMPMAQCSISAIGIHLPSKGLVKKQAGIMVVRKI